MDSNYKIIANIVTLPAMGQELHIEVNSIEWFGRDPKIDIRYWNDDRTKMSKGITMNDHEWEMFVEKVRGTK